MKNEKTIWDQEVLISELESIYALIETCHSALKHHNVLEPDSVQKTLNVTYNNLYEIIEIEQDKLKTIKGVKL